MKQQVYTLPDATDDRRAALLTDFLLTLFGAFLIAASLYANRLAAAFGYPSDFGSPLLPRFDLPAPLLFLLPAAAAVFLVRRRYGWGSALFLCGALLVCLDRTGLFAPWSSWTWWLKFRTSSVYRQVHAPLFHDALFLFGGLAMAAAFWTAVRFGRLRRTGDTHGSARFAELADVEKETPFLQGEPGVALGALQTPKGLKLLTEPRETHTLLYAPTGAGKSTGVVIPTLLSWPHHVIALDLKGELWNLSAGYRKHHLGNLCLRYAPTDPDPGASIAFNPFDLMAPGPREVSLARLLAHSLVQPAHPGPSQGDTIWVDAASKLLTGAILHVLYAEEDKSLPGLERFLAHPERSQLETLELMLRTRHDPSSKGPHPVVAASAAFVRDLAERTRSSVFFQALAALSVYSDPLLAERARHSDVSPAAFRGETPVSLYFSIPPRELKALSSHVRLVLNLLLSELTEDTPQAAVPPRPILLVLDELAAAGRLDFLKEMLAYLRGYGIRVLAAVQDLRQLLDIYGPNETVSSHFQTQIVFRPNELRTAEHISRLVGVTTVLREAESRSTPQLSFTGKAAPSRSRSQQEIRRPLLTPDEVMRLPQPLVLAAGARPILVLATPYYEHPQLQQRAAIPPPVPCDALPIASPLRPGALRPTLVELRQGMRGGAWPGSDPEPELESEPLAGVGEEEELY